MKNGMKQLLSPGRNLVFAFVLCVCLFAGVAGATAEFYVSPSGSDGNSGGVGSPLGSLAGARDAIRQLKSSGGIPAGGVTVWLRGGVYELNGTFELTSSDSGASSAPIVYSAYPGETVQIVGGKRLDSSWFTKLTSSSPVWNRLPAAAQGNVWVADLGAHGIADFGQIHRRAGYGWENIAPLELFFNGEPMQLGRTEGWSMTGAVADRYGKTFSYTGDAPSRWGQAEDVWVGGMFGTYWYYAQVQVTSINPTARTITVVDSPNLGFKADHTYFAFNLLEEIDTPGEWYLDRGTGLLYFWPPSSLSSGQAYVSLMSEELVRLSNVNHVQFQGLIFEASRDGLVEISGGNNNLLYGCELRNAGTDAVRITGTNNGLERCVVAHAGERGVELFGGDRESLTPGGNYVRNSELYDWGRWVQTSKMAVQMEGVGQIISHNEMHDAPHQAIWFLGNAHLIEYNDIYNVCHSTADAGAIYSGRDWGFRGTQIRYNFIHDCHSPLSSWQVFGIYLDDAVSGIAVYGNIVYDVGGFGTFNGGGRDNIWTNNLIVDCYGGQRADRRGVDIAESSDLLGRLNAGAGGAGLWKTGVWAQKYPKLAAIPNSYAELDYDGQGGWKNPGGSVFRCNAGDGISVTSRWLSEGSWGGLGAFDYYADVSNNLLNQDVQFVDEAGGNLNLQSTSPVRNLPGWQDIPFNDIGIQPVDEPTPIPDPQPEPEPQPEPQPGEVIVDNLSSGFSATGSWKESAATDEYAGSSFHTNEIGATASWQPVLAAGEYEVYVWYSAQRATGGTYDRDSAAEYLVAHAGGTTIVVVDQDINSGQWVLIGSFQFNGDGYGAVHVARDESDGVATIADAVRFVPTGVSPSPEPEPEPEPEPQPELVEVIVDNLSNEFSTTGTWKESSAVDEYEGSSLHTNDIGAAATWQPALIAGEYEVYVWYSAERANGSMYDRDSAAEYNVVHASDVDTVTVDQDINSGQWVLLGSFEFDGSGDEYVQVIRDARDGVATIADAVAFVPGDAAPGPEPQPEPQVDPVEVIVDNDSSGFECTGKWKESSAVDEYNGSSLHTNEIGATASWWPELSMGIYDVYVWYANRREDGSTYDRDSAAEYTVHHYGGATTAVVDQDSCGGQWVLLGTFAFSGSGTECVQLVRNADDGVATTADATRFAPTSP